MSRAHTHGPFVCLGAHVDDTLKELVERATYVRYEEFARAHHLLMTDPEAEAALQKTIERLRADPSADFVMGPNFLSALALISDRGREIAQANMSPSEVDRRQRELAKLCPQIAQQFPELLLDA